MYDQRGAWPLLRGTPFLLRGRSRQGSHGSMAGRARGLSRGLAQCPATPALCCASILDGRALAHMQLQSRRKLVDLTVSRS